MSRPNPITTIVNGSPDPALVVGYDRAYADGPAVVGGKGYNLGRLARYGFSVPPGAVLAADAYRAHLVAAAPPAALTALADATAADAPSTVAHLEAVRAAILAAPLPPEVVGAVRRYLEDGGLVDRPLAVRSSATAEDGADASFAGIHESVLGVVGLESAMAAVRRCYASLWTPRALAYRRRFGIADEDVACAVVLCAMIGRPHDPTVPPVAAGVAFSVDPRTGRRDRLVINAARGLGDELVSGHVVPTELLFQVDDFGPRLLERRGPPGALTDTEAERLARLVIRVHWALGGGQTPQDVEWVYDGDRFWLVQARPVTHLPRVTPEAVRDLPIVWSNGNLKDAVAGVPSTLGYSMIQPVLRSILYSHTEKIGYPVPPGMETIRLIDGRAYFDLTAMQWISYDGLGVPPADLNVSLGGMQPEIPVPGDPLKGPEGGRRKRARLRLLALLWRAARVYEPEIARVRSLVRARTQDDLSGLASADIVAWRTRTADDASSFARLFAINNLGTFWDKLLTDMIDRARPGEGQRITSGLLAGSNAVVTAEHGYRLLDLAALAEAEPEARAHLETRPLDPWGWRSLPETSPFRRAFAAFLGEFGHRGVYEVEIANPRWCEDPTYVLEQIRTFMGQADLRGSRERAVARRRAAEQEVRRLPFWLRPPVAWLTARARRAAALREAGKSALVSTLLMTRMVTAELGRRMVAAGVLAAPDDIFHLTWWDIVAWATGEWDGAGARALVADRAAQRAAWLALDPPDVIVLDEHDRPATLPSAFVPPRPPVSATARPRLGRRSGLVLHGTGVSSGRATGTARVIRHPEEGARLLPGDILVAPSTDPGWTPLFLRASAVVMEMGGYLSHGAIVAREYGLPAVVNVPGALTTIKDGQMLEVDGDSGEVAVMEQATS